jgi:hypothetical protein
MSESSSKWWPPDAAVEFTPDECREYNETVFRSTKQRIVAVWSRPFCAGCCLALPATACACETPEESADAFTNYETDELPVLDYQG